MKFRTTFLLLFSLSLVLFVSCSKDDDDPQSNYSFIDQDLQGEFEGEAWLYATGKVGINYFDSTRLDFDITSTDFAEPCNESYFEGNKIIFSIPDAIGLYELNFDINGDIQTITLYHDATSMNNVATVGALEITKIDKVNGIVEGRMDATADDKNFVNGNFSIPFCVE